ncbi:hypothetical protein AG4045_008723 [Apium graveolens]|uniref:Large ribosomal subunit protein uL6 N-terminal domain-containing protein n=1 Tax=Apium graveolens TaxID=4045 RepID=A0A6L5BAP6_APIGR|nr:hypothetical protein AG4045_008723 [Apium graveolens]
MAPSNKPKVSRNPDLIRGVGKYSRSQMYHKRGLWAIKAKNGGVFPRHDAKPAAPEPVAKPPKYYPADEVKKPLANKRKARPTKLRASITPGTVLIILAGRFKGKRVVFLKQLASGLLLVTGQFYLSCLFMIVNASFDDKYFAKEVTKKNKKGEGEFFEAEKDFCNDFLHSIYSLYVTRRMRSVYTMKKSAIICSAYRLTGESWRSTITIHMTNSSLKVKDIKL